jgi:DNA-binding winged helix-turn-helix (wHTH) protein
MGADDYVTKPFSLEELIARVRAVLRRTRLTERRVGRLAYADLVLDEEAMRVSRAGEPIQLSPTEFKLLRCLLLNPERVLSKDRILDRVWQYDFDGKSGVVENYISCLRKKVDTVEPALIHTVRGFGYVPRTESRKRCPAATRSTRPAAESACSSCSGVRGTLDPHTADALPALVPAQRDRRPSRTPPIPSSVCLSWRTSTTTHIPTTRC